MAIILQVQSTGNQTFRSSYGNDLYEWNIQWNARVSRFYLIISNVSTGVTTASQSIEPFSTCDLSGLDFGDLYLLPILVSPTYNDNGGYDIQYDDIGTNLKLVLVTADEITALGKVYGSITVLS